ncbi:DUF305 domain-containing protein [Mycobacterium sp. MBM]|nr:DUF305 domain-containing protein [Mycobacterium sp. MBM]
MRTSAKAIAAAALTALLLAGCTDNSAPTSGDGHGEDHAASHSGTGASPGPATEGVAAHTSEDVAFAQHMIPHHGQAVEMADILLAKDDVDARVIALAEQIRAAQAPEIQQMQGWLDEWGNPPMPGMDHGSMEGMVAPADIEKLRAAPGPEAARLFLDQMIGHHEGAITMARSEIDGGRYAPAVDLARAIIDTQQKEIDQMRSILGSL